MNVVGDVRVIPLTSRADTGSVENLSGWLTTVTARVCLDMLRGRKARREQELSPDVPEPAIGHASSVMGMTGCDQGM